MVTFSSLDDVAAEFVRATDVETGALFVQGQIVLGAVGQGWDVDEVAAFCAAHVRRTKRTIYRRYTVARTFPQPHPALTWEFHAICADVVDYRQADETAIQQQQAAARKWLDIAAAEEYSTRQLRQAIGLSPEPRELEYLLNDADTVIQRIVRLPLTGTFEVVLNFPPDMASAMDGLPCLQPIRVSIVKAPTEEMEAA